MTNLCKVLMVFGLLVGSYPSTSEADEIFTENVIITSNLLCVGLNCQNGEAGLGSDMNGLKIKSAGNAIRFEDISGGSFAGTDWQLRANELGSFGLNAFFIEDLSNGTTPVTIRANAPDNSLYVSGGGSLGIGTSIPVADLHISDDFNTTLRLSNTGLNGSIWELLAGTSIFQISDKENGESVFVLEEGAPSSTLRARFNGNIGMGVAIPEGKLHTSGDGVQLIYFESDDGGPVQVRFRTDSENRRFLAVNNANEVKSQIIFLDDRINFTGATDSGANLWLSIGPDGIISQGPTCGIPCDLTFDPGTFTVPPIDQRAEYMWKNQHLPAIGPTSPGRPMNLTEKMGGVVHELEIAHIYIEQLHRELEGQAKKAEARDQQLAAHARIVSEQAAVIAELTMRLDHLTAE